MAAKNERWRQKRKDGGKELRTTENKTQKKMKNTKQRPRIIRLTMRSHAWFGLIAFLSTDRRTDGQTPSYLQIYRDGRTHKKGRM